jgi:hypothetical protein
MGDENRRRVGSSMARCSTPRRSRSSTKSVRTGAEARTGGKQRSVPVLDDAVHEVAEPTYPIRRSRLSQVRHSEGSVLLAHHTYPMSTSLIRATADSARTSQPEATTRSRTRSSVGARCSLTSSFSLALDRSRQPAPQPAIRDAWGTHVLGSCVLRSILGCVSAVMSDRPDR